MFHGSLVALVTPMDEESTIDYSALERLIAYHLSQGTDGLVIAGTTGEGATLSDEEINKLIHFVVRKVDSRIPVIAGTGANSTHKTIDKTFHAMELGVDACLLMTPAYIRPTQEGLYQHFKAVSEAVPVPQILYNIPSRTACDLLPETLARLADCSNIIGIKEAVPDRARYERLLQLCGDRLSIFSGEDSTAKDLILAGGKGVITVVGNVAPKLVHDMVRAALAGDKAVAEECDQKLRPLYQSLFLESNPIPVKWALHQLGLIGPGIRLPLTPLSTQHRAAVLNALKQSGLLELMNERQ